MAQATEWLSFSKPVISIACIVTIHIPLVCVIIVEFAQMLVQHKVTSRDEQKYRNSHISDAIFLHAYKEYLFLPNQVAGFEWSCFVAGCGWVWGCPAVKHETSCRSNYSVLPASRNIPIGKHPENPV